MTTLQHVVHAEETEKSIPAIEESINTSVKRIVIEPKHSNTTLEVNNTDKLTIFGNVRSRSETDIDKSNIANTQQIGDTLYIKFLEPKSTIGFVNDNTEYDLIVSIPGDIDVEVRSWINLVNVDLREISANWYVEAAETINFFGQDEANIEVLAKSNSVSVNQSEWEKETNATDETEQIKLTKIYGDGKYKLSLNDVTNIKEISF